MPWGLSEEQQAVAGIIGAAVPSAGMKKLF